MSVDRAFIDTNVFVYLYSGNSEDFKINAVAPMKL